MTSTKSTNDLQFSMRALMVIVTVACVVLALPGGYVLLAVGTVWMLIGAAILWVLLIFRAPIYRFLSGAKLDEKAERLTLDRGDDDTLQRLGKVLK